jgi:ribosomal protein S18 acetylase RimI-like enzyme
VIGTATGLWTGDDDTVLVVGMYVAAEARGRGCAHQMLDAIAHLASHRQRTRLVLGVADSNTRAARFYRLYGFVETRRRRQLDRDSNITEIELAYSLPPEPATTDRR